MPTPSPAAPKPKPRWELRAFGLSIAIVTVVGGLSRLLLGLVSPLVAVVGLDGFAGFLVHAAPAVLAFVAALLLNGIAAQSEARGGGLGAWLGFGLWMLVARTIAAL